MLLSPNELTLYCITARDRHANPVGDTDGVIVLGKTAADDEAENLMCSPAVHNVISEALPWDSGEEQAILLDAYFNGIDLDGPVAHIAAQAGIAFDGDPLSAPDALAELRARVHPAAAARAERVQT